MRLLVLIGFVLLMGCASKPPLEQHMDFAPVRPLEAQTLELPTGSILANNAHMSLFQGQRKWKVGRYLELEAHLQHHTCVGRKDRRPNGWNRRTNSSSSSDRSWSRSSRSRSSRSRSSRSRSRSSRTISTPTDPSLLPQFSLLLRLILFVRTLLRRLEPHKLPRRYL